MMKTIFSTLVLSYLVWGTSSTGKSAFFCCNLLTFHLSGRQFISPKRMPLSTLPRSSKKNSCLQADRFMEEVFVAVRVDIKLLQTIVSVQVDGSPDMTKHHCQQCEASLQWIHTLCQQKSFKDYLVKHKIYQLEQSSWV